MTSTMMVAPLQDDVIFNASPRAGVVHIAQNGVSPTNKVNIKKQKKVAGENTGRWTKEEHNTFLEGLRIHGKEWKKIANMIATRSVVQIRTHAQKYFQKLAKTHESQGKEIPEDLVSTATNPKHHSKIKSATNSPNSMLSNRSMKDLSINNIDISNEVGLLDSGMLSNGDNKKKSPRRNTLKSKDDQDETNMGSISNNRLTINVNGGNNSDDTKNRDAEDFKWLVSLGKQFPDSSPTSVADIGFYHRFGHSDDMVGDDMFPLDNTDDHNTDKENHKKNEDMEMMNEELSQLCDTESIRDWINAEDIDEDTDLDLLSCDDVISGRLEPPPDLAEMGPLTTFVFGDEIAPPSAKRLKTE